MLLLAIPGLPVGIREGLSSHKLPVLLDSISVSFYQYPYHPLRIFGDTSRAGHCGFQPPGITASILLFAVLFAVLSGLRLVIPPLIGESH